MRKCIGNVKNETFGSLINYPYLDYFCQNVLHRKCTHFKLFVASKNAQGLSYTLRIDSTLENNINVHVCMYTCECVCTTMRAYHVFEWMSKLAISKNYA